MATNNHNFIISITVKKQAVPAQFSRIDWMGLINETYPIVFASPEDKAGRKSALYSLLQKFAKVMRVDFEDAAYWVSRRVLDDRFSEARRMYAGEKAWDDDVLFTCRVLALQICRFLGPNHERKMQKVDQMIGSVLMTEEELLRATISDDVAIH